MPKLTRRLHQKFAARIVSINQTRTKMEQLLLLNAITVQDIEHVYAGLYMELFTEFESLLEDLFFGLYNGSYFSRHYNIIRKSKISPVSEIEPIIYGGRAYTNWLPYKENTLKRAKLYFQLGEPFRQLDKNDIQLVNDYQILRNAIAHKSTNSLNKFNNIIASLPLLPSEKTPTGYLRSHPSGAGQTQFEIAAIELKLLTYKLCL